MIVLGGLATPFLWFATLLTALSGGAVSVGAVVVTYLVSIGFILWREKRRPVLAPAGAVGWSARLARWTNTAFVISFLAALVALVATLAAAGRPSQAKLAARFTEHRSEYEQLREMISADGLASVDDCGRSPSKPVSPERQVRYKRLLRSIGCPFVALKPDASVIFSLASWGAANRGWRMALVWSPTPPKPLLPTLDGFQKKKGRLDWETAYSRIDGDWYLTIVW